MYAIRCNPILVCVSLDVAAPVVTYMLGVHRTLSRTVIVGHVKRGSRDAAYQH